jgi:hypothetical protein
VDKKDIYEHLAKIYLDASSKSKDTKHSSKLQHYFYLFRNPLIVASFGLVILSFALIIGLHKNKPKPQELALYLIHEATKINFNFNPAKKEVFLINLNNLNLSTFKTIGFSVKKTNPKDRIALRIEFTNVFKEKSEIYVRAIGTKWRSLELPLAKFSRLNDWSKMRSLSFTVEEWNAKEKKGVIYIDNVRLIK